jgi:hypothetical protein
MRTRSFVAAAVCAAAVIGATAGPAVAGEITGNGKPTPIKERANSICAFSGQNDEFQLGELGAPRVQSFGQIVKGGFIDPRFFNPGDACQGGSNVPEP